MNPTAPGYSGSAAGGGASSGAGGMMNKLSKGVGSALMAGIKVVNKALDQSPNAWMRTGVVVQLVSKSTGRCLQILQTPDGMLIMDGLGGEGPQFYNAHFTVQCGEAPSHGVYLHNNLNYIAIVDGITQLFSAGLGGSGSPACILKVRQPMVGTPYVALESDKEKGRYVGVMRHGMIKSAMVTNLLDNDAHFAVRVIHSPYPVHQ